MKVAILAGGYGTRISEESAIRPKPLVEIGGRPILWHIMKIYAAHGLTDFVVLCGYKGHMIKSYFANYLHHTADVTFDLAANRIEVHRNDAEPWRVTLVDTGEKTLTGGRIKRARRYLEDDTFCLTYGDGVSDVNITELIDFHRARGAVATLTAVQQPGRFGALTIMPGDAIIAGFREKSGSDAVLINGGFFVVEPEAIDLIDGDDTSWEVEPMQRLVERRQLAAYHHTGFWQNMDTLRDQQVLEAMWAGGNPPWRVWDRPRTER